MLLLMALMMVVLVVCVLLKVEPGRHPVDAAANHGFDDRVLRGLSFTVLSLLCLLLFSTGRLLGSSIFSQCWHNSSSADLLLLLLLLMMIGRGP